ncbi:uncharacterized protein LOC133534830 [Cydia pomonella]|uniref:uncharacterized protein LOC133534830 n=1 Tax=Cydia pomonella TaxID=82600 RepID=UPI002ADE2C5D|nr:uncharacterized protein LOC133534830 [Cydia pomonella]
MGAPRTLLCLALLAACAGGGASPQNVPVRAEKQIELFDGLTMHLPTPETTNRIENAIVSFKMDTKRSIQEGRGKQKKLMERILPMFIMPFIIQSTIVPMFLSMLKFMLFKSMMVGKVALALIIFNAFRNHNTFKGRKEEQMADVHYGYHGQMEEYGAYIN